jgi:hypothetical protein
VCVCVCVCGCGGRVFRYSLLGADGEVDGIIATPSRSDDDAAPASAGAPRPTDIETNTSRSSASDAGAGIRSGGWHAKRVGGLPAMWPIMPTRGRGGLGRGSGGGSEASLIDPFSEEGMMGAFSGVSSGPGPISAAELQPDCPDPSSSCQLSTPQVGRWLILMRLRGIID